ncbi:cobyrinate a,c-diamide synthase [Paenibacillus abyssi]|uniref:Cobyrinate a,c-diamide synthase n=1 Tax=Paenibacillus abyssi TaxID=1340531 RepID=A0A917FYA2_9BACL|nr:cobyrinate a,c-diamide synthase [Paenibacillus abyssi]GGG13975.1 cobyrinate a,c-diamide synthase [Paenibacillus abyssi]
MNNQRPRIAIAGTSSGAGKTTVTIGIMRAMGKRGLNVQGFKCGPDYIDPTYHSAVTGRVSRNLDTWMMPHDAMLEVFQRGSDGADVSVIEGVMGLYDGKDPLSNAGSTAHIATLLDCPVILVVNVQSMARSSAAVVLGYQKLDEHVRIAGVIVNKCGSEGHYRIVKSAIEQECGIPVVGWLGRDDSLEIPERHLGLVPAIERGELNPLFDHAAERVEATVDLDRILAIANDTPSAPLPVERLFVSRELSGPTIAVARDAAFNFYYEENLELLKGLGANIITFSPLAGDTVPAGTDGIYIGGGFPEEYASTLANNIRLKEDLRALVLEGMPVYAECGGYMYLCRSIKDRSGQTFEMAGIIPAKVEMQPKLAALGYREARAIRDGLLLPSDSIIRGHEFHYSSLTADNEDTYPYAYETKGLRGIKKEGYCSGNVLAGYTHVHFSSNPESASRWIEKCSEYRNVRLARENS